MKTFLGVTISALVAMGLLFLVFRDSAERRACKHMFDLTEQQIEEMSRNFGPNAQAREMRDQLRSQRSAKLDQCEVGLEKLDIDPSCILDADDLGEATACMKGMLPE
jgi:uncharacterized membrane protein YccC